MKLHDCGHARDYVEMQWRMLQQQGPPEDSVIATGWQESVRRFIEPTTTLELLGAEMVGHEKEQARNEALLWLKGFRVVGSMEKPPTNPIAVEQVRGAQG